MNPVPMTAVQHGEVMKMDGCILLCLWRAKQGRDRLHHQSERKHTLLEVLSTVYQAHKE